MKKLLLCLLCWPLAVETAPADTFGEGANQFTIEFVIVGDPGNPDDSGTTGSYNSPNRGGVASTFQMGKYEVSGAQVYQANAVANLGIPAVNSTLPIPVSWNQAARFVNFLNEQTGAPHAYKFDKQPGETGYDSNADLLLWTSTDPGYDASNLFRNGNASYFLPSDDEWYKAAYYSGSGSTYFDYPTGSDSVPVPDVDAIFGLAGGTLPIDQAGTAFSPYGTLAQGGNVVEWTETQYTDGLPLSEDNTSPSAFRFVRGGFFNSTEEDLRSSGGAFIDPGNDAFGVIGFRVARVAVRPPEISVLDPDGTLLVDGSGTVDLGNLVTGDRRTFTLRNDGDADLTISPITFGGADGGDFSITAAPASPIAGES